MRPSGAAAEGDVPDRYSYCLLRTLELTILWSGESLPASTMTREPSGEELSRMLRR